ncbi:carboxypeptidase-like regulatory domain-containing protein [Niabella ginsengisoli]|uniref:Carboxypeptidase-like regulatory domain-containing protein n=1 Tax=Niabella ginsengisoli TaxID=522298 RepID=A0ABS9SPT3_9BACT|nr:carboxypeptidase-like regulatory domain-containing protein [Niabella ginsengisoli]MCH5600350.1 carboxypeptidase-like regulatory domain-containing protein [Niabella ginsengisoli]
MQPENGVILIGRCCQPPFFNDFFIMICALSHQHVLAQNVSVTGVVTDDGGKSLVSVNITEKGKTNGTTSGENGSYRILVSDSSAVLVFSMIGYLPFEKKLVRNLKLMSH